jgi:hypothetical protein
MIDLGQSTRAVAVDPDAREELFDRARDASTKQHQWPQADRLWTQVIEAYREAVDTARWVDRNDERQLARARWRHGMLLAMMGRPADGLATSRAAVADFERIHAAVAAEHDDPTSPRRDEALAELITAMIDAGEVAFAADQPDVRFELVERALAVGLQTAGPPPDAGPRTARAMGTAFHNQATALLFQSQSRPSGDGDATPAAMAASRAVEIRQHIADPADLLTLWELANTYALYAQCLTLMGDTDRASMVVRLGTQLTDLLGPGAAAIRTKLQAVAEVLREAPQVHTEVRKRRWFRRG